MALGVRTEDGTYCYPSGPSTFLILDPRHVAMVVLREQVELTDRWLEMAGGVGIHPTPTLKQGDTSVAQ